MQDKNDTEEDEVDQMHNEAVEKINILKKLSQLELKEVKFHSK